MISAEFLIEAQGNNKGFTEKSLQDLVVKIEKNPKIEVIAKDFSEAEEDESGAFSAIVEVKLEFSDFYSYITGVMNYGPSAIEVLEPDNIKITQKEFIDTLGVVTATARKFYEKYQVGFQFRSAPKDVKIGLDEGDIDDLLDQGAYHIKLVMEGQGKSERDVVNNLVYSIEDDVFVNQAKATNMDSGDFKGLVGIEAFIEYPNTLFDICLKHTPVLIEIMEPKEVELSMYDLQELGIVLGNLFFEVPQYLQERK